MARDKSRGVQRELMFPGDAAPDAEERPRRIRQDEVSKLLVEMTSSSL